MSRVDVKLIRGRVIPCDGCKIRIKCEMYRSAMRHRSKNSEYMGGTNIIHACDIYQPDRIPQDIRNNARWNNPKQEDLMAVTSQELRILARGKLKGKMKTEAPKEGHPVMRPPKVKGPKQKNNPAYTQETA